MIYSIGYQQLTLDQLKSVLDALSVARLIDVRTSPHSRKRGYTKRALEEFFRGRYLFAGDRLGGRAAIKPSALNWLAEQSYDVAIMCMEEAPGECHRHMTIAVPLLRRGVDVRHIFENDILLASELQRMVDEDDDDYSIVGHVFPERERASW